METPLHSSGSSYHRVSSFPSPFHVAAFWLLEIAGLVLFRCFLSDCWMCAACSPWQPLTAQEQNSISLRLSSPTLLASPVQHPRLFRLFLLPPLQRCQFEGACLIEWATFIFMCGSVCSSRSESTSSHSFIKECWMRKRTAWAVLCDFWLSHLSSLFSHLHPFLMLLSPLYSAESWTDKSCLCPLHPRHHECFCEINISCKQTQEGKGDSFVKRAEISIFLNMSGCNLVHIKAYNDVTTVAVSQDLLI